MSSSVKQYNLPAFQFIPTQTVSANFTSNVTNIFFKDNIGIQLAWTGTLAGTFAVQVSADYNPNNPSAATWTSITLSSVPTAAGSPDNAYVDITQISAPFIRVVFTYSSGSGNLTGTIVGKAV